MFIGMMLILISQAPLGAACDGLYQVCPGESWKPVSISMPLLTELGRTSLGTRYYKHGAPNGACPKPRDNR